MVSLLHREGLPGVDFFAGTILTCSVSFLLALAALVAIVVLTFCVGCIASVRSGGVRVGVAFKNIELGAPTAAYVVGITVVVTSTPSVRTVRVPSRHQNEVKGNIAAAVCLGEVDVELDGAAVQVWPVPVVRTERRSLSEVAARVVMDVELSASTVRPTNDVHGFILAILFDRHGRGGSSGYKERKIFRKHINYS